MDLWTTFTAATAQFTQWVVDQGVRWLPDVINSTWLWGFLLATLVAVWISTRFVVRPLSRLIDSRAQAFQLEGKLHVMANELKYVRLTVDQICSLLSSLKEERQALEDARILADELRFIGSSLRDEREESLELRTALHEIHALLNFFKNEHQERADELRSGLNSLVHDYERAIAD